MRFKPGSLSVRMYPELRWYETAGIGVGELLRAAGPAVRTSWLVLVSAAALVLQMLIAGVHAWSLVVGGLILVLLGVLAAATRDDVRCELRTMLRERGVDPCPSCAYDLTGTTGHRCPECGRTSDPV